MIYKIGMLVKVGGKLATVTGFAMLGDQVFLLWVRWADGKESAIGARELKNVMAV